MGSVKHTTEKALHLLRTLPRVSLGNIRDNPNSKQNVRNAFSSYALRLSLYFPHLGQTRPGTAWWRQARSRQQGVRAAPELPARRIRDGQQPVLPAIPIRTVLQGTPVSYFLNRY